MPVLVIAVVFFVIFLVMGVLGFSAMAAEHKGHLFSWRWTDEPITASRTPVSTTPSIYNTVLEPVTRAPLSRSSHQTFPADVGQPVSPSPGSPRRIRCL